MLSCSNFYKEKMKVHGKKINVLVEFEGIVLDRERVINVERNVNGELFTSIMRSVTLEVDKKLGVSTQDLFTIKDFDEMTANQLNKARVKYLSGISTEDKKLSEAKEVNIKVGVKLEDDEDYEYTDWGSFDVYQYEDCVDTNSYKLTLYDHLIDTHINYDDEPINLDFESGKVTVGDLFQAICNKFGFTNKTPTFTNSDKLIIEDKYLGLNVTYRDILDEIAGVAGGFIKIFNKDLYVTYPQETGEIIDENHLKSLNVGEKVGTFNTLVLSRSPQEDNIYYPQTIPKDDRVAIRIENNQIMDKNREDFIVDLHNQVNGLEYYPFEYESFGAGYHEFGDIITLIDLNGKEYKTIMMNIVDVINTGITEKAYSEETTFAETKYEYATSIEKRVRNTEIICNKQDGQILLLVEEASKTEQNITQIKLDINGITENVSQITSDLNTIESKAVKASVEAVDKELGLKLEDYPTTAEVETKIETKAGQITTDLTATIDIKLDNYNNSEELAEMFGNYSTTIQMENYVNETVNSFERTISQEVTTQISDINITTDNLVYNSVGMLGIDSWGISQNGALSTDYNADRCSISKRAMIITTKSTNAVYAYTPRFEVNSEGEYVVSGWVCCEGEGKGVTIDIFSSKTKKVERPYEYVDKVADYQETIQIHTDYSVKDVHEATISALHNSVVNSFVGPWYYFKKTIKLKNGVKSAFIRFGNKGTKDTKTDSIVYLSDLMVVEGNKAMHWNVSSKDTKAQIEANSTSIIQTNSSLEAYAKEFRQGIETNRATIEVNAKNITLKLDSSEFTDSAVISLINNRGTSVAKIKASNIELTANDILNIISGNTINLTSKNITISSTNFNVDKTGKVTCSNIDATGKITATSGSIGKFQIKDSWLYVKRDDGLETQISEDGIRIWNTVKNVNGHEVKYNLIDIGVDDMSSFLSTQVTNNQISTTTFRKRDAGYLVYGRDTTHNYSIHWAGTHLQAYVDNAYVGIIALANNGYTPFSGDIPIVNSITEDSSGNISWNYSNLHVSNGVITGYSA